MTIAMGRAYTLKAPLLDGTYGAGAPTAVLGNAPADANLVGYLDPEDGVSGLDSPLIRVTSDKIVGGDGEIPGPASHGPRPVTFKGKVIPTDPASLREAAERRLELVTNLILTADGQLTWTEEDTLLRTLMVRATDPVRVRGFRPKEFFCGLVAYQPRIFGVEVASTAVSFSTLRQFTNAGTKDSPPRVRIDGPQDSAAFHIERRPPGGNPGSGPQLKLGTPTVSAVIPSGTFWTIDFLKRTVTATTSGVTTSKDGAVDPLGEWWTVPPSALVGGSAWDLYLGLFAGAGTWRVWTRNAW